MTGVILLSILILLILILLTSVRISVIYENNSVYVLAKVLFLKFRLFPTDETPKIKQFSAKGIRKKLKKDKEKHQKQIVKDKQKKNKRLSDKSDIVYTLKLVADILSAIQKRFLSYLRIKVANLSLVVASDDAAKTAIEYGLAVQGVQYIVTILDNVTNFSVEKKGNIYVGCDFCNEKITLELDITFLLKIWQIIAILLRAGVAFVLNNGKNSNKKS